MLQLEHLRFRRQPVGSNTLHCVLLDMSASMLRGQKLAWAKGCLLALSGQFYRRREHLCVIGFSGSKAKLLQVPGKVTAFNEAWIAPLQGGGGTPIASAMELANALLGKYKAQKSSAMVSVWLLTDGRFDPLPARPDGVDVCQIVDLENEVVALQRCERLAQAWDAELILASELERAGL